MAEKMLVTQGLNELKMLDNRIEKAIDSSKFIIGCKISDKNAIPGKTKEDFISEAKASMQSIKDLIARREKIKNAIIDSNAKTEVTIAGTKMTVAKAIDTKSSIGYYQHLLGKMKSQYTSSLQHVISSNEVVKQKIDQLLTTAYGKEGKDKITEKDYEAIANPYKAANEFALVDPLNLEKEIKELETFVEDFCSNVDAQLQISNCATFIEI